MTNSKRSVEPDSKSCQSRDDSNQQNKRQKTSSESPGAKGIGLLDDDEKKARHIASEKKRREAIRNAFDKLVDLVPSLTPAESRTEVSVLTKSANFIDLLNAENKKLVDLLLKNNIELPAHLVDEYKEL